jgi:hypothetical protein
MQNIKKTKIMFKIFYLKFCAKYVLYPDLDLEPEPES